MPKKTAPSPLNQASAAYARAVHYGTAEEAAAARTELNEAKVRAWVEKYLATAPPHLTPATEARLTRLLVANGGGER
jgi:hypothetical protein